MPHDPFALDDVPTAIRPLVKWALGARDCRALYQQVTRPHDPRTTALPFERRVLAALDITIETASNLKSIPTRGPLVVASNHPHGVLDGLALVATLRPVRPDVRIVANHLLARIPELHDICFFVDPFDRPAATVRSLGGLRAAHLWLRKGGALVVFPAGEVAHGPIAGACHADSPWKPTMSRLASAAGAAIVRAHIQGGNSTLFYAAGRVHPALRAVLLAREFLKKRGAAITIEFNRAGTFTPTVAAVSPARFGFSRAVRS